MPKDYYKYDSVNNILEKVVNWSDTDFILYHLPNKNSGISRGHNAPFYGTSILKSSFIFAPFTTCKLSTVATTPCQDQEKYFFMSMRFENLNSITSASFLLPIKNIF